MAGEGRKQIAGNRKAFHDYFVEDKYEAGIELAGTEVKSIRMGNVNLKDAFCTIKDGQMTLNGMHVSPYEKGNIFNREPRRPRRLLMHKREILRLFAKIAFCHVLDAYLLHAEAALETVSTIFYLSNEGISILENVGKLGVPLPKKVQTLLSYLKKSGDNAPPS